ncbi:protein kinase, putative [Trypanosoma brucei gambiense DAL972]|uniref:Protein kinase, putative n=1 Tax=Trypanosoma brucei gambiense (strain MHOM/CI/86/DAL972) TaxID=679716 RepID=C9ZWG7_TRYB9|nr:protein kinase, putative [Trypanosoma brucei gambiense DAL972]CBH13756.1 protein kinase, putative [Trypanosoma brucei gambiense DAL972]|eukprot:XP_011776032.1 protein kinase, putative [Trypanosoma brucei gambiense DAL972]
MSCTPATLGKPPVCDHCGAPFTKSTAKFCSKCGTKKKGTSSLQKNLTANVGQASKPSGANATQRSARASSTLKPSPNTSHNPQEPLGTSSTRFPPIQSPTPLSTVKHEFSTQESLDEGTLRASPEEEAKYTALTTLNPEGITPEMLQTANSSELGTWRKGLLIGRGTYGSVFLGLLDSGAFYAVKCVEVGNKTGTFSVKELVSLSREINMMQRLSHKNLCTFKGVYFDPTNSAICMFMEYIGGGSLSALVKKFKPLPPNVIRRWTRQLLCGLLYLHSQRIIHRDIKGDNILVDTSCDPEREAQIKLVDFGAARRLSDAVAQSRTVIGTPYWMAPEVVDVTGEAGGYSYKADVWSVGCTVAEMHTGKPPWPSQANAAAAIMMIAQSPEGPTELPVTEATSGCLAFMRRCLVRDPIQRPTVEELLQDPWILGETE